MASKGDDDYSSADHFRPAAEEEEEAGAAGGSASSAASARLHALSSGDSAAAGFQASALADRHLYGGDRAFSRAAVSGNQLRRSQSAAGADRLREVHRGVHQHLVGWQDGGDAGYGAVTRTAAGATGASASSGGRLLSAGRHEHGGADRPESLGGCWAESDRHLHHQQHLASAARVQHWTLQPLAPVGREPVTPGGSSGHLSRGAASEHQRGWQFPWRRSRKSHSSVSRAQDPAQHCASEDGNGREFGAVAASAAAESLEQATSKRSSKRGSKVRRKCSQIVAAIRSRFTRKVDGSCGKHGVVLVRRRHSVDSDAGYEPPELQPWALQRLHDRDSAGTAEVITTVATRHWDTTADAYPAATAGAAAAIEIVGNGWQWHRGAVPTLAPAANAGRGGSSSTGAAIVARYPRERHHAFRIAPRSPLGPGRVLAQPPASSQQLSTASAYSITSALASAGAAASFTSSPSASGAVRAHTTVDYAHFLVPDLRSIANSTYYWCVMDRYEAERALEGKPEGTFLLRDSAQDDFLFSVSFRRYGRSLHARVEQRDHAFSFDAHDVGVFRSPTVTGLVEHYKDADSCLFFEPLLTRPLPRPQPLSLLQLARSAVCGSSVSYDGVAQLPLPRTLVEYVRYYHYKHKVRSRTVLPAATAAAAGTGCLAASSSEAGFRPES